MPLIPALGTQRHIDLSMSWKTSGLPSETVSKKEKERERDLHKSFARGQATFDGGEGVISYSVSTEFMTSPIPRSGHHSE